MLLKPFRQFGEDFDKTVNATPAPLPSLTTVTPSPTPIPTAKPVKTYTPPQPVVPNCIRKNIREGEFASNKCYSEQDYEDLQYFLGRFESAKLNLSSAEGFEKIDCGAAQTFEVKKADCEKDKQDKAAAEAEVNKYRGIIQGIITKGQ